MLKIGKLKLNSHLILAPMAGVSDLPFRMLNRQFGCELAFIEMLNVRSVSFRSIKTQQMLSSNAKDRPLGIQILGSEPKFILRALEIIRQHKFDLLDFNAACPVKKVVSRGEGAGLLKQPRKLAQLLKIIVKEAGYAVTLKMRIGWDKDSVNAREVALLCEDAGVNGIFIHGRTKMQGYSGSVDYQTIGAVKKAVKIPVIASGDILSPQLAKRMWDETGCDGLAIARGSLGNPWIFKEIGDFLGSGSLIQRPPSEEVVAVMMRHLSMCVDFYSERVGVMIFRKFFTWYTKGLRHIRQLRERCSRAKTHKDMIQIIEACINLDPVLIRPRPGL